MLTSLLQGSQHCSNFRPIHRLAANLSKLLIDSLFHTRHPLRTAHFKQPMLVSCEFGWAEARFMFCLQVVLQSLGQIQRPSYEYIHCLQLRCSPRLSRRPLVLIRSNTHPTPTLARLAITVR